jgi:hypothetical protein
MVFSELFERFALAAPACVMHRALMEQVFSPESIDGVFRQKAESQYERELLFSTLVELTSHVVCRISKSMRPISASGSNAGLDQGTLRQAQSGGDGHIASRCGAASRVGT